MNRYAKSRDKNHSEVADYLRRVGVDVAEIFDPVDLLCYWRGFMGLVEVKQPGSRATYTRTQLRFMALTMMPVFIAKTGEDAFEFMQTGKGLTPKQKSALASFLTREKANKWHPAAVERVLNV